MKLPKYRAWDHDDKKMWKVVAISESIYGDCEDSYIKVCEFDKSPMDKETDIRLSFNFYLMQFTGLYDKNGKEIYEGDILLVTSEIYTNFGKTPTGRFSKEYYEVIWKDDGWGHKVLKSDHTIEGTEIKGLKVTTKYVEVIGNIYENPELLEESK